MGRITTEATIESLEDLLDMERGALPRDQVRRITVTDAIVDADESLLSLPTKLIRQLGLTKKPAKKVVGSSGRTETNLYGVVRLTIQGRDCPLDVCELPDCMPVLVGRIPLTHLDFVVDPVGQRITGNPAHGGEQIFDL
jgi:hypothetical protein